VTAYGTALEHLGLHHLRVRPTPIVAKRSPRRLGCHGRSP
jgi:hypothetical protein